MTKRTERQIAADEKMTEAIREAAEAYGVLSGAMLIDFMVICEGVQMDMDREDFGILFMDNRTRSSVAYGLLEKAGQLMQMSDIDDMEDD